MADPHFFQNKGPFTLGMLAEAVGAVLYDTAQATQKIKDVAPLESAGTDDISFLDNPKYVKAFQHTEAGACILHEKHVDKAPDKCALLISSNPYHTYALVAAMFYPTTPEHPSIAETAVIHPTAKIGNNCEIGDYAVIGAGVEIGNHCTIHPNVTISHSLIGDHVIIHPGACIGQDGFGYAHHQGQHVKVPQLGRVIIKDHVEIGANTTIDRGAGPDTVIGEGTKIDNLVQLGHNVQLGKGCIVVSQVGISGSTIVGDYTALGGQVGVAGHLKIGAQTQISAQSGVTRDIPEGETVGGTPAVPMQQYHRQTIALQKLGKKHD